MTEHHEDGKFRHADMHACAFIMCHGYKLLAVEEVPTSAKGRKQCVFVMDCPVEVGERMMTDYLRDKPVPALTNRHHLTTLKENLFNLIKN